MGLADVLQHRLRRSRPEVSLPVFPTQNTRTAARKRRKLLREQKAAGLAVPQKVRQESDDDEEEGVALDADDIGGAYKTLVSLLADDDSESDVGPSSQEDDSEEPASDEELDSDTDATSEEDLAAEASREKLTNGSVARSKGVTAEALDDDTAEPADAQTSASEDEREDGAAEESPAPDPDSRTANGKRDGGSTFETLATDTVQLHLERVLTEDEVASLAPGSRPLHPAPKAVQSEVGRIWPEAQLLASDDVRLPAFPPSTSLASYGIKERLVTRWRTVQGATAGAELASGCQAGLFALLSSQADILHTARPYPTSADPAVPDPELDAILLHILQHCASNADRIRKNNERLKTNPELDPPRDQGFTRPTVLLLLPMRNMALRAVQRLAELALAGAPTDSVQHRARLLEEFEVEEGFAAPQAAALARKPPEHRALFSGNTDDHFRLGVRLMRGTVKLYADFHTADVIVASPLALATKLTDPADREGADFLSSLELVVMDRADVVLMQNWEHAVTVFKALNAAPRQQHDVDIMRVREWQLAGRARHYRQTVVLSSLAAPEMGALMRRCAACHAGSLRLEARGAGGVLARVLPQLRQEFERLPRCAPAEEPDLRFQHFKESVWPRVKENGRGGGQLIYVPAYFDFVRVRNFLRSEDASLLLLSEYTDSGDAARARAYFRQGRRKILLYTERAQFYNRGRTPGIQDAVFYQLPTHPQFYEEILNQVQESEVGGLPTITVLFSTLDALRLERVVGRQRAARMLKPSSNSTFLFC
ncbi:hypothetical protein ACKKBF_B01440 [Auxenochlorella protothecoides x Auxenochlorella symbiontica]